MKLYEIKDKYVEALREVCELNDCTPEEAAGMLDKLDGELEDKVLAIAAIIKNLEADALGMSNYIDSMQEKYYKVRNKIDWLKNYIKDNMIMCHKKKLSNIELEVSLRNCKPSIYISPTAKVPDKYSRTKMEISIDKVLLRENLEKGEVIDGVSLVPNTALYIS